MSSTTTGLSLPTRGAGREVRTHPTPPHALPLPPLQFPLVKRLRATRITLGPGAPPRLGGVRAVSLAGGAAGQGGGSSALPAGGSGGGGGTAASLDGGGGELVVELDVAWASGARVRVGGKGWAWAGSGRRRRIVYR